MMKERGSDHERSDSSNFRGGRSDNTPNNNLNNRNSAAACATAPTTHKHAHAHAHAHVHHKSQGLSPLPNNTNNNSGEGAWTAGRNKNKLYRKLGWALLVGFYVGVTVTIWIHTVHEADSHLQQEQAGSLAILSPHVVNRLPGKTRAGAAGKKHHSIISNSNNKAAARRENEQATTTTAKGQPPKIAENPMEKKTQQHHAPEKSSAVQDPPPVVSKVDDSKKNNVLPPTQPKAAAAAAAAAAAVESFIAPPPEVLSLPSVEEQAQVRQMLQKTKHRSFLPLQAVVETPTLSNLATADNNYTYIKPLALRTHSKLQTYTYFQNVHSCDDLPNGWPVDHPQELDTEFGPVANTLGSLYDKRDEYAQEACPVDADPFLPWIHDVFPTPDGQFMEFVANNKRRCRQDPSEFRKDIDNLEPQVALLQSVPVQRVSTHELEALKDIIPEDWKTTKNGEQRYRLSSIPDADEDGKETRFLCHFHALNSKMEKVLVGETLSVYPYNYEHANYQHRRGQRPNPMLTRPKDPKDVNGIHNEQIWNAVLHFRCPVPIHLQSMVAEGSTVHVGIPSLYVDVVPIRTPPREGINGYNSYHLDVSNFNPIEEWGPMHILPPVEKSGRWANIPVCKPVVKPTTTSDDKDSKAVTRMTTEGQSATTSKENYLTGCLWASASFSVRGEDRLDTSTSQRLLEWLTYHLDVAGFDKMVIYDNTEAFTNLTSLQSVTDLFPGRVERIPWKHRVCNNNRPTHPNAGERSSQYAAEASCRIRYGDSTEWMMSFDTDEYLVPQGKYISVKEWLQDSVRRGVIGKSTHVLNFYQIRASLNSKFMERYYDDGECAPECKGCHCLAKRPNATFFESFCDPVPFPKPDWTGRAKKQLYRPSFVLNHFVHYAAVTRLITEKPNMPRVVGYPYERRVVELTEAFMLHTKTKPARRTKFWKSECLKSSENCPIGFPRPYYQEENTTIVEGEKNKDGYLYNCWESRKIHEVLADRLRSVLAPIVKKWTTPEIAATKTQTRGAAKEDVIAASPRDDAVSTANVAVSVDVTAAEDAIQDFVPGQVRAVIATKIQGNSTLLQLEQSLCLLKYAYNDRVNYDIVVFAATPITEDEANILKAAAAPSKLTIQMDNPGLEVMVANLKPEKLAYLLKRCNVTDASQLTWKTRCLEKSSGGITNMPIQYTWQAEFRSLHIWNHPALSKYKYMMWLDSDGFCTKKWEQDPIASMARNDLAILFDHFPQGQAKGTEWGDRITSAFGKMYCRVDMVDGHLVAFEGDCQGRNLSIKQVHGFFHITNLEFFRSKPVMKWARIMVGDAKFSRMFDDQIGVTMPAAVLAGNRSWDMRAHGINLGVLHSYKLDGQDQFGGFLNYWKKKGEEAFPEAHGNCKITQHG